MRRLGFFLPFSYRTTQNKTPCFMLSRMMVTCGFALPRMDGLDFSDFGHRYVADHEGLNLLEAAIKKILMMDSLASRTGGTCE
jgi:hypothetical protein